MKNKACSKLLIFTNDIKDKDEERQVKELREISKYNNEVTFYDSNTGYESILGELKVPKSIWEKINHGTRENIDKEISSEKGSILYDKISYSGIMLEEVFFEEEKEEGYNFRFMSSADIEITYVTKLRYYYKYTTDYSECGSGYINEIFKLKFIYNRVEEVYVLLDKEIDFKIEEDNSNLN